MEKSITRLFRYKSSWFRFVILTTFFLLSTSVAPLYAGVGDISTIAGNGIPNGELATTAPMMVKGVEVDNAGNIYIAASFTGRVYKVGTDGLISTVAGNGTYGYSGDGGLATMASLSIVEDIAVDSLGNLYISDTGNNRIRKIDVNGIITTVAGNGVAGFSGDGGPASSASLNYPQGITTDSSNNLYITDASNNRLRKVDLNGTITTVAGNGVAGFSGDGGSASNASLYRPWDAVLDDAGNIYIADKSNHRVRKIDISGIITTVAGNGESGFSSGDGGPATSAVIGSPADVAIDSSGNMLISSAAAGRVRKVDVNGIVTTLVSQADGIAQISRIAIDSTDNLYITDYGPGKSHVRMLANDGSLSIIAGNGSAGFYGEAIPANNANLYRPTGLSIDNNGSLLVVDRENQRIRRIDVNGVITTVAGNGNVGFSGDGGSAVDTSLYYPADAAVDSMGNIYIADDHNHRIRKVDVNGIISTIAGNGTNSSTGDGGFAINATISQPNGIVIDASDTIYFTEYTKHRVRKIDVDGIISTVAGNGMGGFNGDGGPAINANLKYPADVTVNSNGELFIADTYNNRIRKVDVNGIISSVNNGALNFPYSVALGVSGDLYVAERLGHRISKVSQAGTVTVVAGVGESGYSGDGQLAIDANLSTPSGVTVDAANNIYIADTFNNRIRRIEGLDPTSPTAVITSVDTTYINTVVAFDASSSSDPNGDPLTYNWDFGDGNGSSEMVANHAYAVSGTYTVTLHVFDGSTESIASKTVTVLTGEPTAVITSPDTVYINTVVAFDASSSSDPNGDLLTYNWDFGDGNGSPEMVANHTYTTSGTYTVTLSVFDGNTETIASKTVTVLTGAPTAVITSVDTTYINTVELFDASASSDPNGDPLTYNWDFGDGNGSPEMVANHTYATSGTYTVTLSVFDGNTETIASKTVTVLTGAPTAVITSVDTTYINTVELFDASASSDPNGDPLTYNWDFGDGNGSPEMVANHTYVTSGTYTVTLSVFDGNTETIASKTVTVLTGAPTAVITSPDTINKNESAMFDASASSDPNGDPLTYNWDFGDGNGSPDMVANHTYASSGTYTVTLHVFDGNSETTATKVITVINHAPVVSMNGPDTVNKNNSFTLDASQSSDPDGDPLTFTWNLGDGATETGVSINHAYTASGSYTVTLTVSDDETSSSASKIITVLNQDPVASAGANQTVIQKNTVTLNGSSSHDPDAGDSISYKWTQVSGRAVVLSNMNNAIASFTAPRVRRARSIELIFELEVTDEEGATNTDTVSIIVKRK